MECRAIVWSECTNLVLQGCRVGSVSPTSGTSQVRFEQECSLTCQPCEHPTTKGEKIVRLWHTVGEGTGDLNSVPSKSKRFNFISFQALFCGPRWYVNKTPLHFACYRSYSFLCSSSSLTCLPSMTANFTLSK